MRAWAAGRIFVGGFVRKIPTVLRPRFALWQQGITGVHAIGNDANRNLSLTRVRNPTLSIAHRRRKAGALLSFTARKPGTPRAVPPLTDDTRNMKGKLTSWACFPETSRR